MKSFGILLGLCCLIFVFGECLPQKPDTPLGIVNTKGEEFAGASSCTSCHSELSKHFNHTAHASTSAAASEETVHGSFEQGKNIFALNYYERVIMEKRDSGLYQQALHRQTPGEAQRFDLVIGSGNGGQSYLYWKNDGLFQLPVSYHGPAKSWSGSPGYTDFSINFKRPVTPRCMECHSTFAKTLNPANQNSNRFDKEKIIPGVTCESCHGAAGKHVAHHKLHPEERNASFIISPSELSRQLQLDLCGLCHSGLQENLQPPFTFSPGDSLSLYYKVNNDTSVQENLDVHGNKFALLQSSKCFRMSPGMTCSTCHNTHKDERGKLEVFASKCRSCHTGPHTPVPVATTVGMDGVLRKQSIDEQALLTGCVSCHMPQKSSKSLTVRLQNDETATPAVLRTHHIAVYPEETANLYRYLDSAGAKSD